MGDSEKPTQRRAAKRFPFRGIKLILFFSIISLLAVFFMGGWQLIANRLQKVVAATWGMVEKGCWIEVLYLREEKLLTAPASGCLTIQVKNGARVPQGEVLALLDQGAALGRSAVVTNSVRQSYNEYQRLVREEAALTMDLRRINADLRKRMRKRVYPNDEADLEALQQEKGQVIRNIQTIHAQSAGLQQEMAPVLKRWRFIAAEAPGSFSTEYDGWEGSLPPEYLSRLTLNDFARNYPLKSGARQVKSGAPFGRLINPFNQIMAFKINAQQTGIPQTGAIWRFKTASGWKNAPLIYVKMFDGQTGVAGAAIQAGEADLTRMRLSRMFAVYQSITGVTVPASALYKKGKLTLIRVMKGDDYREKAVQVLGSDGSRAVISGIKIGTMIISR
jgi:hypothetical protein